MKKILKKLNKSETVKVSKAMAGRTNSIQKDFDKRSLLQKGIDKLMGKKYVAPETIDVEVNDQHEIDTTDFIAILQANYTKFTNKSMHIKGFEAVEVDLKKVYPPQLVDGVLLNVIMDFVDDEFAGKKHWSTYNNGHFNTKMRKVVDKLVKMFSDKGSLVIGTQNK